MMGQSPDLAVASECIRGLTTEQQPLNCSLLSPHRGCDAASLKSPTKGNIACSLRRRFFPTKFVVFPTPRLQDHNQTCFNVISSALNRSPRHCSRISEELRCCVVEDAQLKGNTIPSCSAGPAIFPHKVVVYSRTRPQDQNQTCLNLFRPQQEPTTLLSHLRRAAVLCRRRRATKGKHHPVVFCRTGDFSPQNCSLQ